MRQAAEKSERLKTLRRKMRVEWAEKSRPPPKKKAKKKKRPRSARVNPHFDDQTLASRGTKGTKGLARDGSRASLGSSTNTLPEDDDAQRRDAGRPPRSSETPSGKKKPVKARRPKTPAASRLDDQARALREKRVRRLNAHRCRQVDWPSPADHAAPHHHHHRADDTNGPSTFGALPARKPLTQPPSRSLNFAAHRAKTGAQLPARPPPPRPPSAQPDRLQTPATDRPALPASAPSGGGGGPRPGPKILAWPGAWPSPPGSAAVAVRHAH